MTQAELRKIREYIAELLDITDTFFAKPIAYKDADSFQFMALLFLARQCEHANSVAVLCPSRDAAIVARSMIEGLYYLLWAQEKPDLRPGQWREYAAVANWKLLQSKKAKSKFVDATKETEIMKRLNQFGDQFLKQTGQNLKKNGGELLSKHFYDDFLCKTQISDIPEELMEKHSFLKDQHHGLYEPFTDWAHWGTFSMAQAIKGNDTNITYVKDCYNVSAAAASAGFQCLHKTIEIVNTLFNAELETQLADIEHRFIRDLTHAAEVRSNGQSNVDGGINGGT